MSSTIDHSQKLNAIAELIDWKVLPGSEQTTCGYMATMEHKDSGARMHVSADRYECKGKFNLSASWPRGCDGTYKHGSDWNVLERGELLEISVSDTRTVESLAKDIKRRIADKVVELWPQAIAAQRKEKAELLQGMAIANKIASILKQDAITEEQAMKNRDYDFSLYRFLPGSGYGHVRMSSRGSYVNMGLRIDADLALKVLKFLSKQV